MRLGREVVDLVGADVRQKRHEPCAVGEVSVVEEEAGLGIVRVDVQVVHSGCVEGRGPADEPVDLVALGQEEFGEVRAVLARDAGDERLLRHVSPHMVPL
ncbi:hypothetical protein SAT01_37440 [Sinomonas atrocyanea]|nr:hypothetical protein SAT01_37440 [Sinomonas atrocyanea]GGG77864.1 hypothetical protein GCM10007172_33590 [Sinomonas atrocyanea]